HLLSPLYPYDASLGLPSWRARLFVDLPSRLIDDSQTLVGRISQLIQIYRDYFGASSDRANSPMRSTKSGEPANFSISLMMALPTTAASAKRQTSRTCSAVETPNPTATGKSLTDRTRFTRVSASRVISSRAPVTPARETASMNPRACSAIR